MGTNAAVSWFKSGLFSRCPRCAQGRLFNGYLNVADKCEQCGLNYGKFDSADGPAVFIMFIVGFIVVGGALVLEVATQPPYWVHAVIWGPLALALSLLLLRPFKALMIALQYKNDAAEGRRIDG